MTQEQMQIEISKGSVSFKLDKWPTLEVAFIRTLRIPDDGRVHSLPAGIGTFPVEKVEDYASKVPPAWNKHGGVFFPMHQAEALWLSFRSHAAPWALKVAAGKICAISGRPWTPELERRADSQPAQNYVVMPRQPWLDGFNSGDSQIRQFVAEPLGSGYTVEGQVTGKEEFGGIQLAGFAPNADERKKYLDRKIQRGGVMRGMMKSASFPEVYSSSHVGVAGSSYSSTMDFSMEEQGSRGIEINNISEMGMAQGGRMVQQIFEDENPLSFWDQANSARVYVHIVNSESYKAITGKNPPPSPITQEMYTKYGIPWFTFYSEQPAVAGSPILSATKSIADIDHAKTVQKSVSIPPPPNPNLVKDGEW